MDRTLKTGQTSQQVETRIDTAGLGGAYSPGRREACRSLSRTAPPATYASSGQPHFYEEGDGGGRQRDRLRLPLYRYEPAPAVRSSSGGW